MEVSMQRLSTGNRITNAGDDAAGLAIASKMTSQIEGLQQAARNAGDAISMIQTADGAFGEITSILQRMRELTVQASSATNSTSDITALNTEFTGLRDEVASIVREGHRDHSATPYRLAGKLEVLRLRANRSQ